MQYLSSLDETVYVSQEHIDTAIKIYQELSKASRSKRISWKRHKRMMEREGFNDSDVNESYRQLIKRSRKKAGVLPSVEKHADMVADSKLESIKEAIGDIESSRLQANDEFTRLSRLKREWNRELVLYEIIEDSIKQMDLSGYKANKHIVDDLDEEKEMLITLNDIHYGYEVEGYYNRDIAKEIVDRYAEKVIDLGLKENVTKIVIANEGDSIEGRLRRQSIVDSSISHIEQTTEVSNIIVSFIKKLSEFFDIKVFFLIGNHCRLTESYKDALEGESVVPIIENIVDIVFAENENVELVKPDSPYHHIVNIRDYNVFTCHGDRHKVKDPNLLHKLSVNYDTIIDVVLAGHLHSHQIVEVGINKYQIITGSIKGVDAFSEKINSMSSRSQVAIIFDDNGFDIRQIGLDNY